MKAIPTQQVPNCPKCNSKMVKRPNKRTGEYFWGCSQFPKCRGTRPMNGNVQERPTKPTKSIKPNHCQVDIFRHVQGRKSGNLIIKAGAGTGKTTTLEQASFLLPRELDIVYIVYNAHVRDEALPRMPAWLGVMTSHQKGLRDLVEHLGKRPKIDDEKVFKIIKSVLGQRWEVDYWLATPVKKVVGLLKNLLLEPTSENIAHICEQYGIEVNGAFERVVQISAEVLHYNNKDTNVIDFDDMLYLPYVLGVACRQYDIVLLDEVQDFNRAQIELVLKSVKSGGRVIAVGDSDQSLYSFRGADIHAMERVQKSLDADELPLNITYRCPLSHVEFINALFPDIPFEAAPNAKQGEIVSVSMDSMLGQVQDGDMVLCRTNAPLVKPAFALIRMGVKAIIRGRDIGNNLISLIEKFDKEHVMSVNRLLFELCEYRDAEMGKLLAANKGTQAQSLDDKVETVIALSDGCSTTSEIITKVNEVFSNDKEGVVFSTVHKAKGLEADNVYILEPSLFPHPMAKKDWELAQERNCAYVAFTRAKNRLAFVGAVPHVGGVMLDNSEAKEVELFDPRLAKKLERIEERFSEPKPTEAVCCDAPEREIKSIPECPF